MHIAFPKECYTIQSKFSPFCNRKFPPISHNYNFSANICNFSNRVLMRKKYSRKCYQKPLLDRVKRIWYLSPMRAAKVQASLRIRAVSPEPSLLAHTSSESRGTFRQKARSLAPLNGWACAVKICHDGMLEDTNLLDGALLIFIAYTVARRNAN